MGIWPFPESQSFIFQILALEFISILIVYLPIMASVGYSSQYF